MNRSILTLGALIFALSTGPAFSTPVKIEVKMAPVEQIKLDFKDGSGHFVLFVRREGKASGAGLLSQTSVTEFGKHDIIPGVGGEPTGYLVFLAVNGDEAYVKWNVEATFVAGPDGKPRLLDNGVWRLVGGTGQFSGKKGAGSMNIRAVSATERLFVLDGEITP